MSRLREGGRSIQRPHKDQPLASLGNTVVGSQHCTLCHRVAETIEGLEQELEPCPIVVRVCQREDVLQEERTRPGLVEDPNVVLEERCLRIESTTLLLKPVSGLRERRARGTADNKLEVTGADS